MLAIRFDTQLWALGRCMCIAVDHNDIFLKSLTLRTSHVYHCRTGYSETVDRIPLPLASYWNSMTRKCCDQVTDHIILSNTRKHRVSSEGDQGVGTWSYELALEVIPNVCSKLVSMIFDKKEGDAFYKLMAEIEIEEDIMNNYVKDIEVKYLKITDAYKFYFKGEETDLEHILLMLMLEFHVQVFGLTEQIKEYRSHLGSTISALPSLVALEIE